MKKNTLLLMAFGMFLLPQCKDSNDNDVDPIETLFVNDLNATQSKFALYDLKSGEIVANTDSASDKWDIGFKGTTIIVNSGISGPGSAQLQLTEGLFDEYAEAPETGYLSDTADGNAVKLGGNWYTYTGGSGNPQHAILPKPGVIIVVKNTNNTYSKIQIVSYYQGNPDTTVEPFLSTDTRQPSGYYTFRYVTQHNKTRSFVD